MLEINSAYAECMRMAGPSCGGDTACLQDAEQLLRENRPMHARRLLMGMAGRSAQWNYLFGRALFMLNEHEKAATYLGIARASNGQCGICARLPRKQRSDCMRAENALSAESSRAAAEYVRLRWKWAPCTRWSFPWRISLLIRARCSNACLAARIGGATTPALLGRTTFPSRNTKKCFRATNGA